jgi:hypothetical protein
LWRDILRVVIAPDRLVLVRTARWRARVIERRLIEVTDADGADRADGADWHGAVAALAQVLKDSTWQHTDVRVVLSNQFMRFMLAPAMTVKADDIDKSLITKHYFKEAYGEIASAWTCRMDDAGGTVSMAADHGLIDAITQCFAAPQYRLTAIQPALAVAFNRWRRTFGTRAQWFAMIEGAHACLCLVQDGEWRQVRGITAVDDLPVEVMRTIAREQILAGLETAPEVVSVFSLDGKTVELVADAGCKVQQLAFPAGGGTRVESAHVALALAT